MRQYHYRDGISGYVDRPDLPGNRLIDRTLFGWFRGTPNVEPECIPEERDLPVCQDVRYLQPLLYFLARTIHARTIVEIGVADGSTTMPLLCAAAEMPGGILHSIDPSPPPWDGCRQARELVGRSGLVAHWQFHAMTSDTFFAAHAPGEIDFAFIDGDHCWDGVAKDATNVFDRLVPGGIAIFHEWWLEGDSDHRPMPPPIKEMMARVTGRDDCGFGTQLALREVLPRYPDLDCLPLDFGACGHDRVPEWTEAGALLVRRRRPGEFLARP